MYRSECARLYASARANTTSRRMSTRGVTRHCDDRITPRDLFLQVLVPLCSYRRLTIILSRRSTRIGPCVESVDGRLRFALIIVANTRLQWNLSHVRNGIYIYIYIYIYIDAVPMNKHIFFFAPVMNGVLGNLYLELRTNPLNHIITLKHCKLMCTV